MLIIRCSWIYGDCYSADDCLRCVFGLRQLLMMCTSYERFRAHCL